MNIEDLEKDRQEQEKKTADYLNRILPEVHKRLKQLNKKHKKELIPIFTNDDLMIKATLRVKGEGDLDAYTKELEGLCNKYDIAIEAFMQPALRIRKKRPLTPYE